MQEKSIHKTLNFCIAFVWLINGLFCKLLNLVPRHQLIVASILGLQYSRILTAAIGLAEVVMAVWIITRIKTKLNAIIQILIIAIMNTLEFILVPDLLLWGKLNAVFALVLILVIYFNEFYLNRKLNQQT